MLDSLITSKTRIKLLMKFFLNQETTAYLRGLSDEFGESTNSVRVELNRLADAGMLTSETQGRTKVYKANRLHPLFQDLQNLMRKYSGFDRIEYFLQKLGNVEAAFVVGDYAKGIDSGIIDLVLIGEVRKAQLDHYITKTEEVIQRRIRPLVLTWQEAQGLTLKLELDNSFLLWKADELELPIGTSEKAEK